MVKYIIFTDLDGTLLDHLSYSHHAASHALKLIKGKGIPLIICSSKTRAEILPIRRRLMNKDPFISENGGAVYIPDRYFRFSYPFQKKIKRYKVIKIGTPHKILLNVLREIKDETGVSIEGISEMSIQEIMDFTSLTKREAALAKKRGYSEPFLIYPHTYSQRSPMPIQDRSTCAGIGVGVKDEGRWINRVKREILKKGFKFSYGGRFFHIMKDNDKGKAVKILKKLYAQKYGDIKTIGIGNSLNDLPMLKAVDIPVLVKNYDGRYERGIRLKNLYLADGIGPDGWTKAVKKLIISHE
jgi:mannosyl-3-phosphoglycerate phosphatase